MTLLPLLLEQHAHVYVCGDAKHMSKAVEATLDRILASAYKGESKQKMVTLKTLKDTRVGVESTRVM